MKATKQSYRLGTWDLTLTLLETVRPLENEANCFVLFTITHPEASVQMAASAPPPPPPLEDNNDMTVSCLLQGRSSSSIRRCIIKRRLAVVQPCFASRGEMCPLDVHHKMKDGNLSCSTFMTSQTSAPRGTIMLHHQNLSAVDTNGSFGSTLAVLLKREKGKCQLSSVIFQRRRSISDLE